MMLWPRYEWEVIYLYMHIQREVSYWIYVHTNCSTSVYTLYESFDDDDPSAGGCSRKNMWVFSQYLRPLLKVIYVYVLGLYSRSVVWPWPLLKVGCMTLAFIRCALWMPVSDDKWQHQPGAGSGKCAMGGGKFSKFKKKTQFLPNTL